MNTKMLVVGDRFHAFARNEKVICVSDLEEILADDQPGYENVVFELGQGVSASRVRRLIEIAESKNRRECLMFDQLFKCGSRHVHKHRPENSMLSIPRMVGLNVYEADVLVDDASELMADHSSGQHLQGMVLVEAARQMILAVTEEYYSENWGKPYSFIWNEIVVKYLAYAFPVKTLLVYRVKELVDPKKRRSGFSVDMEFIQSGRIVCVSQSQFEVLEKQLVKKREHKLALASVAA